MKPWMWMALVAFSTGASAARPETWTAQEHADSAAAGTDVKAYLRLMAPRPMNILREVSLPNCTPRETCWLPTIRNAVPGGQEDNGPEPLLTFDGHRVGVLGSKRETPRGDGYVDLVRRTWVRLGCDGDEECRRELTTVYRHKDSPLVGICTRPDHVNTAGGFGSDFTECGLFDLQRRTRLLAHMSQILDVGPGRKVRVVDYGMNPPAWCPFKELLPSPRPHPMRRGPEYAITMNLDLTAWPPRILSPMRRSTYSDMAGEDDQGTCAKPPW